ncbi:uncharacterized protein SOCE26_088560 [Sorangium cellulosum]|uniref:Uncharacterized protein n=1 Tax=Sorangium cellulosum TaxID=56 RepID=A0A2L0F740_SORCE|nr:hypothetical protein [Sorangium cellulosum]AUX47337.1 uncharacterized protein SOCE26_088560 [Sorangium cellulosum]
MTAPVKRRAPTGHEAPAPPRPARPGSPPRPARPMPARGGAPRRAVNPRWLIVMAVLGVTALALATLPGAPPLGSALPAEDEILAYHIDLDRDLVIKIPAEIDAVEVTTWAGVKADACDSSRRYPYGFIAAFVDERGKEVARHEIDLESRVSCDPDRPLGEGEYAARLDRGGGAVTDPRSTLLITHDVLPHGGQVRLRAKPAVGSDGVRAPAELTILSRLEGRYQRSEASRALFEQSLDAEERRNVGRRVSALGFADLPEPARKTLLRGWARRLEAAGREGLDYEMSRLLLRRFRMPFPRAEGRGASEFTIGERHAAALNFRGPVSLDIEGPPGRTVRVADGASAPASVTLDARGRATVQLSREDIRTAVIDGVGPDFGVRFAAPEAQVTQQIGEIVHPAMPPPGGAGAAGAAEAGAAEAGAAAAGAEEPPAGVEEPAAAGAAVVPAPPARLQTPPDVRIVRYLALNPTEPVIARMAPGQEILGLLIRAEIETTGGAEQGEATVVARWGPGPTERAELKVMLPRSRFEWWNDGFDASEPRLALLRPPAGVERIEITGDVRTRVRLRTIEPGVNETLYRLPYRVPLREDETWRYAPFDVSTWTDVRAANLDELERNERFSDLREQVRIERSGEGAKSDADRPERILMPEHAPVRRRLLMPAWQSAGEPSPGDAWTPLLVAKEVHVDGEGARAGQLSVIYRAARGELGKEVAVRVDGEVAASEPIVALSGTLRVEAPPGARKVEVEGLGEGGVAYTDAPPANGGAIVRRRDVFELTRGRPMEYRFKQAPGETLHLVLFVVTPGENADYRIRYRIEGARPASREAAFFRRVTIPEGVLAGRGGDLTRATLWEAATDRRGVDGVGRGVIRLGDDLAPGERVVSLSLLGPQAGDVGETAKAVWVGAVLVGQEGPRRDDGPRLWVEDDP